MKRIIICALLISVVIGCKTNVTEPTVTYKTAKEYIENDAFINLTYDDLFPSQTRSVSDIETKGAFYAGVYRFYKHVIYDENGIGVCGVKSGSELKMSDDLFKYLFDDMEHLNDIKRKDLSKGIKGVTPLLDDKYFEGLLKE